MRLLDVSNGFEELSERRGDQVDDGYEGGEVNLPVRKPRMTWTIL
jgi:hypothetical protein